MSTTSTSRMAAGCSRWPDWRCAWSRVQRVVAPIERRHLDAPCRSEMPWPMSRSGAPSLSAPAFPDQRLTRADRRALPHSRRLSSSTQWHRRCGRCGASLVGRTQGMDKSMVKGVVIGVSRWWCGGGRCHWLPGHHQAEVRRGPGGQGSQGEDHDAAGEMRAGAGAEAGAGEGPAPSHRHHRRGVAGGLLGSTIGGGTGKTVATVAGAAAGAYTATKCRRTCSRRMS